MPEGGGGEGAPGRCAGPTAARAQSRAALTAPHDAAGGRHTRPRRPAPAACDLLPNKKETAPSEATGRRGGSSRSVRANTPLFQGRRRTSRKLCVPEGTSRGV